MTKKFTLFLGLFDKDSKTQKINTLESYRILKNLLISTGFDNASVFETTVIHKHENGSVLIEPSFKIEITDFDGIEIRPLIEKLKAVFNQESVVVQEEVKTVSNSDGN